MAFDLTLAGRGTKVFKLATTVSTTAIETAASFKVFPNPVRDRLTLAVQNQDWKITDYTVHDVQGKLIASGQVDLSNQTATISTSNLPTGLFQLTLLNKLGTQQVSFVKH